MSYLTFRSGALAVLVLSMCAMVPTSVSADNLYSSGTKTWDTSTGNWGNAPGVYSGSTWSNTTPDSAIFEGTAGTVTLGEAIDIGNLTVNTAGYKITGNTLNFSGGSIAGSASGVTIASGITGSPNVNQGSLANLSLAPTAATMTLGTISRPGDNHIYIGGTTAGNSLTSIPKGTRNAKLHFNGSGSWTVGDVYGGEFFIESGDLIVNGTLTTDYRQIQLKGGVLHYNNPAVIGPAEPFYILGGDMDNSSGAAITTSTNNPSQEWRADWTFIGTNGATSDLNIGTGAVKLNANRQLTVQNAATTLTVGGVIDDGGFGYGLTKAGDGMLELTGTSTYLGDTTVNAGTLSIMQPYLEDLSTVTVERTAILDLNFAGTDDVFSLFLDGVAVGQGMTAGALGSVADVKSALITGTGLLRVPVPVALDGVRLWDGGTSDIGGTGNGSSDGGSGTWNTTIENWDAGAGVAHESWDNAALDDTAIFDGSAGTVTLSEAVNLGDLQFEDTAGSGYKITGNTLHFAAGSTITVKANNVTIESGITGAPTVSPEQGGNQNLTFAPTSGAMTLGTINRPGDNYVILGGTTTGNSVVSIPKGSNNAKVRFNGSGAWTVGNVYGGFLYIDSGDLIVNGELTSDYRWIQQSGGVLHYNNAGAVKGPSSGSSSVEKWRIYGGSIDNTSGSPITTSTYNPRQGWYGDWTFIGSNGANSDLNLGTGAVGMTGNRQVTVQNAATTLTVGGVISDGGNGYGLTKAGPGTLMLSGASTYTGDTTVSGGTLALGADNVISDASDMIFGTGTTLKTGGFDDTFGTLEINGIVIFDFENLGTSNLAFANSSAVSWGSDLSIINFGGVDSIQFGTDGTGLTPTQLADITINGAGVAIDSNGFLNAVALIPEPSTTALAVLGLLSLGFVGRRRRRR